MPGRDLYPIGGYKVVYEYANRFIKDSWKVHIVYPYSTFFTQQEKTGFFKKVNCLMHVSYRFVKYIINEVFHNHTAGQWMDLNREIKQKFVFRVSEKNMEQFVQSKIVATALRTAYELNRIKCIPENNKFYFIQGFENWRGVKKDIVLESYKFNFTKITIAPWLQKKINFTGESSHIIYNGFDFNLL